MTALDESIDFNLDDLQIQQAASTLSVPSPGTHATNRLYMKDLSDEANQLVANFKDSYNGESQNTELNSI